LIRKGETEGFSHWESGVIFSLPPGVQNSSETVATLRYNIKPRPWVTLALLVATLSLVWLSFHDSVKDLARRMIRVQLAVPIGVGLVIIAAGILVGQWLGPFYVRLDMDPSYAYLFNGLGLLHGLMPGHTDHPGTTVQELAAITILFRWLFTFLAGSHQSVSDSVLSQPEVYLAAINIVLLVVGAAATGLGILFLTRRTGRIWPGLLVPAIMMSSPSLVGREGLVSVAPEPLSMALAILVVLLALPSVQSHQKETRFVPPMLLGCVLGAGIVTKVTFAPLALFVLALPGIVSVALAGFATAVAMAFFTIPIWPRLPVMFDFFQQMLTHLQGTYGGGPVGLPPAASVAHGVWVLLHNEPIIFVAIAALGMAIILPLRDRNPEHESWRRLFLIGLVVILCQLAITTLKVAMPFARYLVPSLAVIVILTPLALHFFIKDGKLAAAAGTLVMLGFAAGSSVGTLQRNIAGERRPAVALQQLTDVANHANCRRLVPYYGYWGSFSPEYALRFGDLYMRGAFAEKLNQLYPDYVTFNSLTGHIESFADLRDDAFANMIANGQRVCLIGYRDELNMLHRTNTTLLARNGSFFLYNLQGFRNARDGR
jgi:hypothetical protein